MAWPLAYTAQPADGGEVVERVAVDSNDVGSKPGAMRPLRCPSPQACAAREIIARKISAGSRSALAMSSGA
jgi:hypothetical protein